MSLKVRNFAKHGVQSHAHSKRVSETIENYRKAL